MGAGTSVDPATGTSGWSVCYTFSDDLIHWDPRRYLMKIAAPREGARATGLIAAYPSALDPESPGRNFDVADERFYLYFTRYHYNEPNRSNLDRDLVRMPVQLSR